MKAFLDGLGKAMSWFFGRLPTQGQSLRAEIDKLEREFDEVLQKKTTMSNLKRLKSICNRLRILYAKAANKAE